ncbi:MAG: type I 3-dehydroquinate dehydratase [Bacteroidales bacterium]|nr:type I 3-dehydroquinate dehydratase [Bacteroidales bacterium]
MICASIAEKDVEKCLASLERVEMAEIRLDLTEYSNEEIQRVFSLRKKTIATCRPCKIRQEERFEMLKKAIESGATYVDIEYEASPEYKNDLIDFAHKHQCDVIISYHNYDKTPDLEELEEIVRSCYAQGADLAKIATHVNVNRDNSKILSLYKAPGRLVAIGMGDLGRISRIVAPFMGAEFTYASLSESEATAPGQISYEKLSQFILEIQQI